MVEKVTTIDLQIEHKQQGSYFTIPFEVPSGIESIDLFYTYPRRPSSEEQLPNGVFTATPELNIVDLGLVAPDGRQVGASGSDKTRVRISESEATPGYKACAITPGAVADHRGGLQDRTGRCNRTLRDHTAGKVTQVVEG